MGPSHAIIEVHQGMPILSPETAIYPSDLLEGDDFGSLFRPFAVYTRSRQEKALARELTRFQIPFYLPLVPHRTMIRGKVKESQTPLFSGYVFLFATEEDRVRTLGTNRVSQMIPVLDVERLRRDLRQIKRLIDSRAPLTVESRLAPGQRIRIRSGAFAGMEGTVESRRGRCRLVVAVAFLQQGVSIELDDCQLEPI